MGKPRDDDEGTKGGIFPSTCSLLGSHTLGSLSFCGWQAETEWGTHLAWPGAQLSWPMSWASDNSSRSPKQAEVCLLR